MLFASHLNPRVIQPNGDAQNTLASSPAHFSFPMFYFILYPLSCFVLVLSFRLCCPVVSYPPSYKKTPPPVPPRTTTKPLISVTAQSSTESTQDAYQEGRHPRGGLWTTDSLGRPIYSSMDSLDSTKAVTMAMESAASKRHASLGSHTSIQTCDKAVLVSKAEEYLKTPRSSIGIQVESHCSTALPLSFHFNIRSFCGGLSGLLSYLKFTL